ncbi:regulator of G-protein signaling 18 isoform X2 [Nerophis ophidion]|uniref:regulator of G-protein signaling 18 isoform X2 n=1 Tax=Nerophis ophidion TaxID=159077 RepID=UPI002AE07D13|nr:regulator of G-protein signaling 18 isoform X2 [Nerophis ophidion]
MKTDSSRHQVTERKSRLRLTRFGSHENVSQHKKTPSSSISAEAALQWSESFEELMKNSDGVETFSRFLHTEFSEENLEFWLACEEFKTLQSDKKLPSKAKHIYGLFIQADAPKEVNIDHKTKVAIQEELAKPTRTCFQAAQLKVYSLMKKDSYPRFLHSDMYLGLARKKGPGAVMFRRRSRSCVFAERGDAAAAATQPSPW